MPFLPLFFRQLGETDLGAIAIWTGLTLGVTPGVTAFMAPFWGRLADRFGRKLMILRSLMSFIVVMVAMLWVTHPWQVFALRAAQGFFAGYGALALTMAAESAPPARLAFAIGLIQMAQRLGPAIGPIIGGVAAQLVGLPGAFVVAAGFYALGLLVVWFMYTETPVARAQTASEIPALPVRAFFRLPNFLLLMSVIFSMQFIDRSFGPILSLFLGELGLADERVPLVAGFVFAAAAAAGAAGNLLCAKLLLRTSARTIVSSGAALAALASLVFAARLPLTLVIVAAALLGFGVGVSMTAAFAVAGGRVPSEARATGIGLLNSAQLAGLAVSPPISGLIAAWSIRNVFLINAAALAVLAVIVARRMGGSADALPTAPTGPVPLPTDAS